MCRLLYKLLFLSLIYKSCILDIYDKHGLAETFVFNKWKQILISIHGCMCYLDVNLK